jgi:hypothetical protein
VDSQKYFLKTKKAASTEAAFCNFIKRIDIS